MHTWLPLLMATHESCPDIPFSHIMLGSREKNIYEGDHTSQEFQINKNVLDISRDEKDPQTLISLWLQTWKKCVTVNVIIT